MTPIPIRPERRIDGYTMAEVLIVLLLISIMASMAVPSMSGFVERAKTRRALDALVSDITLARQLAVSRGVPIAVSLSANATYTIDTLTASNSWIAAKTVDLGSEFKGVEIVGPASRIEFSSRGILTANADTGYITIRINGVRDSALVSGAGRIYRAY